MEVFNRCHLFVQAIYLSDIVEPSGLQLLCDHTEVKTWNCSNLTWLLQLRPSKCNRLVWKRFLLKFFVESDRFWTLRQPRQPLGGWFDDSKVHHKQWPGGLTQDLGKCFFQKREG